MAYSGTTKFNTPKVAHAVPSGNPVARPGQGRSGPAAARLRSIKQGAGLKGPAKMG